MSDEHLMHRSLTTTVRQSCWQCRKPGQVAAQPDSSGAVLYRGARSGNANFDPITGKFAGKKLRKLEVVAQTVQGQAPTFRAGIPNRR